MTLNLRLLLAFCLSAALLLAGCTEALAKEMVSAARDNVMMRNAPGPRATAKWSIDRGYPLEVTGRKGRWLRVRDFEHDRAWVLRSQTSARAHVISTVRSLNLRRGPSTLAGIVTRLGYGDVMRMIGQRDGWIRVRTDDGRVGWVSRSLVWGW